VASSVLILEDDRLIGQMLAELLREAGYQVVGPAASIESALDLAAKHGINAALLDIDLGAEGLCFGFATMLQAQRIAFAFLTAYPALLMPLEFRNSLRIEKPFFARGSPDSCSTSAWRPVPCSLTQGSMCGLRIRIIDSRFGARPAPISPRTSKPLYESLMALAGHMAIWASRWSPPINSRIARTISRASRRRLMASALYRPCFQLAFRERSLPYGVRGPVDEPPCIRQRPLAIAGPRHACPDRVRAPQRLAFDKSPGGLPFLSHPRRVA
jgi:hypothetical protein